MVYSSGEQSNAQMRQEGGRRAAAAAAAVAVSGIEALVGGKLERHGTRQFYNYVGDAVRALARVTQMWSERNNTGFL